jgi:hypothetical protein
MILSSWNWVISNSPERPGEEALKDIIGEILQEMEEQMGFKENATVAPLETVQKMMSVGWVWRCMTTLEMGLIGRSGPVTGVHTHPLGESTEVCIN